MVDYQKPFPTNLGKFLLIGTSACTKTIEGFVDAVRVSKKQLGQGEFLFPLPVEPQGKRHCHKRLFNYSVVP